MPPLRVRSMGEVDAMRKIGREKERTRNKEKEFLVHNIEPEATALL